MTTQNYFKIDNLTVGYNNKPLISDINISISKGEILTLIGPNGSGKSTILKSITKHLATISGVVYIDKQSLNTLSNKETATKMSVVLTERVKTEMMTCGEVVALGRYPYTNSFGKLTKKDKEVIDYALKKVHATDLRNRDFTRISDGQRQRILLARAICQEPEIIVLDEPTSFLDIRHKIELLDILQEMSKEKNITVIASLHEIDLAPKISDKVICVKGDRIMHFGKPREIFTKEIINDLYDIKNGSYNMMFGSVELCKTTAPDPEIFILSGNGTGIMYYRELQKRKIAFSTGILYENDVDFQVARDLASLVFSQKAFYPITNELFCSAKEQLLKSKVLINTNCEVGEFNKENHTLLCLAKEHNIKIISSIDEMEIYLNGKQHT